MSLLFWRGRTDKNTEGALPSGEPAAGVDVDTLLPIVKEREWLQDPREAPTDLWVENYNERLIIAYAEVSSAFRYLRHPDVKASGIAIDELRQRALKNLAARMPPARITPHGSLYLISVGGHLEASLLLLDEFWKDARLQIEGPAVIAVPDRDFVALAMNSQPRTVWDCARTTSQAYRSQPYPVSSLLFTRSAPGPFMAVDTALNDESHPIPTLDVIDALGVKNEGGATLALLIATPLDASPRSVFRLFKKIEGYLAYVASDAFRSECGVPSPENTSIRVRIHLDSAPGIFDLLDYIQRWVEEHHARLTVNTDD